MEWLFLAWVGALRFFLFGMQLDKASVLGGAVKHIKQLDKRVKFFEKEEKKRNQPEELLVSAMKKPRPNNDNSSSSAENVSNNSSCDHHSSSSVEVQVTSSGGDMLIKIECKSLSLSRIWKLKKKKIFEYIY